MAVSVQGLMNAIVIEERDGVNAYDVCMRLKDNGLLVSPDAGILHAYEHYMAALCCCCGRAVDKM